MPTTPAAQRQCVIDCVARQQRVIELSYCVDACGTLRIPRRKGLARPSSVMVDLLWCVTKRDKEGRL